MQKTPSLRQLMERASGLHQRGQLAEAEGLYQQVLRANPQQVEAQHLLGVLRAQQGRLPEAVQLVQAALVYHGG